MYCSIAFEKLISKKVKKWEENPLVTLLALLKFHRPPTHAVEIDIHEKNSRTSCAPVAS